MPVVAAGDRDPSRRWVDADVDALDVDDAHCVRGRVCRRRARASEFVVFVPRGRRYFIPRRISREEGPDAPRVAVARRARDARVTRARVCRNARALDSRARARRSDARARRERCPRRTGPSKKKIESARAEPRPRRAASGTVGYSRARAMAGRGGARSSVLVTALLALLLLLGTLAGGAEVRALDDADAAAAPRSRARPSRPSQGRSLPSRVRPSVRPSVIASHALPLPPPSDRRRAPGRNATRASTARSSTDARGATSKCERTPRCAPRARARSTWKTAPCDASPRSATKTSTATTRWKTARWTS